MSELTKEQILYRLEQINGHLKGFTTLCMKTTFEELAMDSLEMAEMIFECEKSFDIDISDQEIEQFETISQLVDLIYNKLQSPETIDPKPTLQNKVFEALGAASICWNPRPSTNVFESTEAEKIGKELMEQIESDVPNAIKVLQKELAKDKKEGSYYYEWQSNIAMAFVDAFNQFANYYKVHSEAPPKVGPWIPKISNDAAKNFLDLLISQTK